MTDPFNDGVEESEVVLLEVVGGTDGQALGDLVALGVLELAREGPEPGTEFVDVPAGGEVLGPEDEVLVAVLQPAEVHPQLPKRRTSLQRHPDVVPGVIVARPELHLR